MITVEQTGLMEVGSQHIYHKLIEGAVLRSFVKAPFRQIGKTTQLIRFAKQYNLAYIAPYSAGSLMDQLRRQYDYPHIYSVVEIKNHSLRGRKLPAMCVIDEGVEPEDVTCFDIVTGIVS